MRRSTVAAALLIALTLGAPAPPAWAQPPGEIAACHDGSCTLRLTGPVTIPLDGRAGVTGLSVSSIGPFAVAFRVHRTGGGDGLGVVGRAGSVRFTSEQGSLAVRVLELGPDAAVIELSTQPDSGHMQGLDTFRAEDAPALFRLPGSGPGGQRVEPLQAREPGEVGVRRAHCDAMFDGECSEVGIRDQR